MEDLQDNVKKENDKKNNFINIRILYFIKKFIFIHPPTNAFPFIILKKKRLSDERKYAHDFFNFFCTVVSLSS